MGLSIVAGDGDIFAFGKHQRRKGPISSRITSPPGVSTEKFVLASASPPGALTSFSVMVAARCFRVASATFAWLHAQVGGHDRVGRVGALREPAPPVSSNVD